ncbi:unnamed protein product [Ilex paraguariensis]|uniref:Secreted protein n=1 Tax=Ilex paraguariensis TaxID=185542 RepID=A0ABC8SR47_9AQUA
MLAITVIQVSLFSLHSSPFAVQMVKSLSAKPCTTVIFRCSSRIREFDNMTNHIFSPIDIPTTSEDVMAQDIIIFHTVFLIRYRYCNLLNVFDCVARLEISKGSNQKE